MATSSTLRWGILGCARISRGALIPGIRRSETGRLAGLASRDRETAQNWAREFRIPKAYGSYEELIDDPEIQAVYIPLPNELHRLWTFRAADAGKHVLCEKPLALDAGEAEAMVEHCRARGVILMEAFMWRHQPRTRAIREMIADGILGSLRLIRVSFSFPIDAGDWRLDPKRGGGALWDVGCYGLSTARHFAGSEPEETLARARFGPSGVDLSLVATLRFPGDLLAQIDCSFEQPFRCAYELVGSQGALTVPDAYLPPRKPRAFLRSTATNKVRKLKFDGRDQYAAMVDAFAAAVARGRLEGPAEDGLQQMRGLGAILDAARTPSSDQPRDSRPEHGS